jgi:hypothetical protein
MYRAAARPAATQARLLYALVACTARLWPALAVPCTCRKHVWIDASRKRTLRCIVCSCRGMSREYILRPCTVPLLVMTYDMYSSAACRYAALTRPALALETTCPNPRRPTRGVSANLRPRKASRIAQPATVTEFNLFARVRTTRQSLTPVPLTTTVAPAPLAPRTKPARHDPIRHDTHDNTTQAHQRLNDSAPPPAQDVEPVRPPPFLSLPPSFSLSPQRHSNPQPNPTEPNPN